MNKHLLKKLIKEVIREAEEMASSDPKSNSGSESKPNDDTSGTMKQTLQHEKEYGTTITLGVKGLSKGNIHILRDFIKQAAWDAKKADLEVISAEVNKDGKEVATMDISDLKVTKPTFSEKDPAQAAAAAQKPTKPMSRMSPEERLAQILPGEREAEWKAATEKDMADTREKERRKKAKIAAGTYDPEDTSLWTDKEWDAYNQTADDKEKQAKLDAEKSGQKYRPSYKMKTVARKMPRLGLGTLKH